MKVPIAIAGSIAQRAGHGGHAWVFMQYLLGLRRLGYEPLLIDHLTPEMCLDSSGEPSTAVRDRNADWFIDAMRSAGLESSYSLLLDDGGEALGVSREAALGHLARSPFLLNVTGFLTDEEMLSAAPRRVFLDIDPGFSQMWYELGLADVFRGHDAFLTIAENISQPDCTVPTCGLDWIPIRQPVALEQWGPVNGGSRITTVASWRGPFDSVEYEGRTYGLRAHEFRKYADLPRLVPVAFEVALEIDAADRDDVELLTRNEWTIVDPTMVAGDPRRYRSYVQDSRAEVMIAKNMYVDTRSGWFSDRSACYLASGKPVLAQDTGFTRNYPTGEGLLSFRDVDEAAEGAREICANWERHAKAAREIAEEYFDARKVLGRLLEQLGVA